MKKFYKSILTIVLFSSAFTINAQSENTITESSDNLSLTPPRKAGWKLSLGYSAIHMGLVDSDKSGWDRFKDFGALDYTSYPSAVTFGYFAKNGLSYDLTGAYNEIDEKKYYALDGKIHYNFGTYKGWLDPSVHIGGGYTFYGKESSGNVGGGIGLSFWLTEKLGLTFTGTYKHQIEREVENNIGIPSHLHFLGSVTYRIVQSDRDKDGILDEDDACPDVFGLAEFNGCPDTDGDGVVDHEDECPEVPGLPKFKGCPDTDGDGIEDRYDQCPEKAGLEKFNGCPDTDGDGIEDRKDECPTVAGLAKFNGCPDTDGDGIVDHEDACPKEAGLKENNGCPIEFKRTVQNYQIGKFNIQDEIALQDVIQVAKQFPNVNFVIEGHTDSTGKDSYNDPLSIKRAESVKAYLVANGIDANRFEVVGYGSKNPIDDNKTSVGRANNRRSEIKSTVKIAIKE